MGRKKALLLKAWMQANGYGRDYDRLARELPSRPAAESIRQVANGYRRAGWPLSFEIEARTGIDAHELRGQKPPKPIEPKPAENGKAA